MVYGSFKDFPRRTTSGKLLCDKISYFAKNPKCGGYKRALNSKDYKISEKLLEILLTQAKELFLMQYLTESLGTNNYEVITQAN